MRPLKHYLAALVPVKKWRRKIRGQKNKKINSLAEQVRILDNKISQVYKMLVLKEVAPDLLKHFKTDLFPIDDSVYDAYKTNLIYQPEIEAIRNQFSIEQEFLTGCLSHVENDVPYEKRCEIFKNLIQLNTHHKPMIYFQAISNSFRQRDLDLVRLICERMEQEPGAWEYMMGDSWLWYINLCLLQKREDKAIELLKQYVDRFGYLRIEKYLPVAALAERLGITDEKIAKSSVIFEAFDKTEKDKTFEKMVKGKRVAIVGNGPQELGSGNGQKIDSYDVVIRFNGGAKTGKEYAKDYGTKTTILARYQGAPFLSTSFPLLGHAEDIYFTSLLDKTIDDLYWYVQQKNKITFFPYKNEMFKLGINTPTTGIQYLWWVKHINPNFSMDDCYGFSFKDKEILSKPVDYYDPKRDLSKDPHNMIKEKEIILNLLKKG